MSSAVKLAGSQALLPKTHRIALIGNPAVGKSALFERLTEGATPGRDGVLRGKLRARLCHGLGVVPPACGACNAACAQRAYDIPRDRPAVVTELLDTPGCSGIFAAGDTEQLVRGLLGDRDVHGAVLVLDPKNLRRSLALALGVAEFGIPVVLDLNMIDEASSLGIQVDDATLERAFNAPVTRTDAIDGVGVRRLAELLADAQVPARIVRYSPAIESALTELEPLLRDAPLPARAMALSLLAGDAKAHSWAETHLDGASLAHCRAVIRATEKLLHAPARVAIANAVHAEAERIVGRAVTVTRRKPGLLARFGRVAQRPLPGALIALAVVAIAYLWVGAFAATMVVDTINTQLFVGILFPLIEALVEPIPSEFVRQAIIDTDFGILPTGIFLAVGIVMPVLFAFYLLHGVLEDSGYLPRLAVLLDRLFRKIGLNGQALIPLVLGFSCITMAVISTRVLPSKKERILLTLLLSLGIPCAPLLAVMVVILGSLPWTAAAVVAGTISLQIVAAGWIANRIIPGRMSDLILEIPPMRVPSLRRVLVRTGRRTWEFLREAVPIFLAASVAIFLFHWFGGLELAEVAARPITRDLLGLPDQAVHVFMRTAIRREAGASELTVLREHFDNVQLVVTLVVMTFLVPCVNAAFVIFKERGVKTAVLILGTAVTWALTVGALLRVVLRATGIVS